LLFLVCITFYLIPLEFSLQGQGNRQQTRLIIASNALKNLFRAALLDEIGWLEQLLDFALVIRHVGAGMPFVASTFVEG